MTDQEVTTVKIGLHIEEDAGVPVPIVQLATDPETDVLHVVATNYPTNEDGARAVAGLLELAAAAIRRELGGESPVSEEPKEPERPRFNPKPAGRFKSAGEH